MAIELDDMLCEADATATPEHVLRWADQSGQEQAQCVIHTSYTKFQGIGFDVTGTVSSGSAAVTSVSPIARIVKGMSVTGTNVPGGTTVESVDSVSQFTMSANATGSPGAGTLEINGVSPITVTDPVINFGYNTKGGGVALDPAKTQAYFQIEGNFDRGATGGPAGDTGNGSTWSEAFVSFTAPGETSKRPLFIGFNPETNETQSASFGSTTGFQTTIQGHVFGDNSITLKKSPSVTGADTILKIESHSGNGSLIIMSNDGDDPAISPKFQLGTLHNGTDNIASIRMTDNAATPSQKTGRISFWADDSKNTIQTNFGGSSIESTGMVNIDCSLANTTTVGLYVKPIANQIASIFRLDGNSSTGAVEANKWYIQPKGNIACRESGNGSTTRAPIADGGAAFDPHTTTWNMPTGRTLASTEPDIWQPFLTDTGALFWVPGWLE